MELKNEKKLALLFSDLHTSTKQLSNLINLIEGDERIRLIVSTGDFLNMGEPVWFIDKLIDSFDSVGLPFVWVPGNNDFGRGYHRLNSYCRSVEGRISNVLGVKFTGVGGSPASWSGQYEGQTMIEKKKIGDSIFLSHYPPPGIYHLGKGDLTTPLLISRKNNPPAGRAGVESRKPDTDTEKKQSDLKLEIRNSTFANRRFADSPLLHICGHLHYRVGTAYLGQTKVVQLGALETGHYAIMGLDDLSITFERF